STPSNGEPSSPETPDTSTTPSTPPTSDPYNPPSQQNPWIINRLIIMVFVAVCIITIPMVIIAYQCGKRKTDSAPYGTKINEKQI
ncbi:MAG: hypothetical protein FWG55_02910, partial [Candidatus Bathyarchaeota archaeon]|nr:hypothetical protein [Candidatus Termiticorpusculum sp.]